MQNLSELFTSFVNKQIDSEEIYLKFGTVKDVDTSNYTFTFVPSNDDPEIFDVKLKVLVDGKKEAFAQIPKDGTNAIIGYSNRNEGFLIACQEVDKIEVTCDDFIFNEGNNGGLINIEYLLKRLTNLEQKVNLITAFLGTKYPSPGDIAKLLQATILIPTTRSPLEDEKITH